MAAAEAAEDLGPLEELAAVATRDLEALTEPSRKADLAVRLSLLSFDLLDDEEAGHGHAELAGVGHAVALRILFAEALARQDGSELTRLETLVRALEVLPTLRLGLLSQAAEAWLLRFGDAGHAVALLREVLDADPANVDARELLPLALSLAGDWEELATFLETAPPGTSEVPAGNLLEAAHVRDDRLGDAAAAAALLERALGSGQDDLGALVHLIEIAATPAAPPTLDAAALLRRTIPILSDAGDAPDQLAITYLLATELERRGEVVEAASVYAELSANTTAWGAHLALLGRRRLAVGRGAWDEAASTSRALAAGAVSPVLARAHLRRAAELTDARLRAGADALAIYRELAAGGDTCVATTHAFDRLRLEAGDPVGLAKELEASARGQDHPRKALARAAALFEGRQDLEAAVRMWREALADVDELVGWEELIRLYRRKGDRDQLARAYHKAAACAGDDRIASAYLCAAGAVWLAIGHMREAEEAFREAAHRAPGDPFARLGLASLLRRGARWRELCDALAALEPLLSVASARAAVLGELGRVTAKKLADAKGARAYLERALELSPDDAGTLHALAELCGDAGDWDQAVALRERAVVAAGASLHAAVMLIEIGGIEESRRKDDEAARGAYERALEIDERSVDALRALAQLHRKARRHAELLSVLRRELALVEDPQRRLNLHLEIARHADQVENDEAGALADYRAALAIDPASGPALAGVERICRRGGHWDLLAEVVTAAPRTARNVKLLAEVLEKLERWSDLVDARRAELELTDDPKEGARLAVTLAVLQDEKLHQVDEAVRSYRRALELEPGDDKPRKALARLFEAHERWFELVAVLEEENRSLSAEDAKSKVAILLQMAALRRDKLDEASEAAAAFEAVLELEPQQRDALDGLEALYGRLGREDDLLHALERKVVAVEGAARAEVLGQIAEIRERRGDADRALESYREAFTADPANRNTFTAVERLCYKHERWREVMGLYDAAIASVESKQSRAYRLGDLYARRGQIQLQYLESPADAAASYLRVIELEPDNDTALRFLESIYSQRSDWQALIAAYEKRAELTANDDLRLETLRRAARVASAKQQDAAEAGRLYERVLQVDPADSEALDALERHYEKGQAWEKLVSVLTMRLATAGAGDAAVEILTRIGTICEDNLRDETRAIDHYRRVLEIAPGNREALDALGRIYESTEKWVEFVDITRRQIRVTTDRSLKALLYFKCGSVMESKFSKEEDAIRYYDAAIKTAPSCLPAVHGLRDLYLRRKDWERVIQTLELEVKLWQDDKERAGVFAQIGQIYGEHLADHERALHYFESALAVDPECLPANKALFELYYSRGDHVRAAPLAQALAQKAMREGEPADRSEFYRKRGVVARQTGEPRAAAESLIVALEIKPDNLQALDELGALSRAVPDCFDFPATYRELEKIYRKRDDAAPFLARCLVATAALIERQGDLDTAEKLHADALAMAPGDLTILQAAVDLQAAMRRYGKAEEAIRAFLRREPPPAAPDRIRALMWLAELQGDGQMDPSSAAATLEEVLKIEPEQKDALYQLAQQLYLLGRYGEARSHLERLIEIAAAPEAELSAETLARYYYYLGRLLEQLGESRPAGTQYRRAAEYDSSYAPPVLALAKRHAEQGGLHEAENLLIQSAHAAMERGGASAAVPLQRGLARILLAEGERKSAIEAYRGILAVEPDNAEDRVALAEIYGLDDLPKAVHEIHRVLDRDLRHAPAYRLLANLYERMGQPARTFRVNTILELLGYSEEGERAALQAARTRHAGRPRLGVLSDEIRAKMLVSQGGGSILGEVFSVVAEQIAGLFVLPPAGSNLVPHTHLDDPVFQAAVSESCRIFGVEAEVLVGDEVYGGMIVLTFPKPLVTISRALFAQPDAERRFLLGRAFDSIRGGYAPLMRLNQRERQQVGTLLKGLLAPEAERAAVVREFVAQLPRRVARGLDRFAGAAGPPPDDEGWLAALAETQDRAGLLACDDVAASVRAIARLNGEELAVTPDGAVAIGSVPGGMELVRYFIGDDYDRLVQAASEPSGRPK